MLVLAWSEATQARREQYNMIVRQKREIKGFFSFLNNNLVYYSYPDGFIHIDYLFLQFPHHFTRNFTLDAGPRTPPVGLVINEIPGTITRQAKVSQG